MSQRAAAGLFVVVIVVNQGGAVEAHRGERGGHGRIVLEPAGAPSSADEEEYPKADRGGCQADDEEHARYCTLVVEEPAHAWRVQ